MSMKFYAFWRSIASFRVRIALALKGIKPDEIIDIDLLKGKQREDSFRAVNPQMLIPALIEDGGPVLFQSMAIMEYLERRIPSRRCCRRMRWGGRGCAASARFSCPTRIRCRCRAFATT